MSDAVNRLNAALETGRLMRVGWKLVVCLVLMGCSDSTSPGPKALRAGTYSVFFTVPFTMDTPGGLVGTHELTFRVTDPVTQRSSFVLLSSILTSHTIGGTPLPPTSDYLDPDPRSVIAGTEQWRLQWHYRTFNSLAVRLNMSEGRDGEIRLPFGCGGVRNELENFRDFSCVVQRIN